MCTALARGLPALLLFKPSFACLVIYHQHFCPLVPSWYQRALPGPHPSWHRKEMLSFWSCPFLCWLLFLLSNYILLSLNIYPPHTPTSLRHKLSHCPSDRMFIYILELFGFFSKLAQPLAFFTAKGNNLEMNPYCLVFVYQHLWRSALREEGVKEGATLVFFKK